ncbi:hypothetical protein ACWC5I_46085, partial [Kitasatospora sp. NPDC001574]
QALDGDGWQPARYPLLDPEARAVTLLREPDGTPDGARHPLRCRAPLRSTAVPGPGGRGRSSLDQGPGAALRAGPPES